MIRFLAILAVLAVLAFWGMNFFFGGDPTDTLERYTGVDIGRLNADTYNYDGKLVRVEGTVDGNVGILGVGGYTLTDSTGSVFVIGIDGIPPKGENVAIYGLFKQAFVVGESWTPAIRPKGPERAYMSSNRNRSRPSLEERRQRGNRS